MTSQGLMARVAGLLQDRKWLVEETDEPGMLVLHPSDGPAPWPVIALVGEEPARVVLYSVLPDDVPEANRSAVAELLARAGYGLLSGALEIDLDDGEVRVRTGVDLGRADHDDATLGALLDPVIALNLTLMDTIWDALQDVAAGRATPAEAAARIEF